jgi:hypothetical protein
MLWIHKDRLSRRHAQSIVDHGHSGVDLSEATMNNTSSMYRASRVEIAGNRAVSVEIGVGATIRSVRGRIWITQEGDTRDYCIPAGVTFCADRSGRAVLTAIDGQSVAIVRDGGVESAGCVPGSLRIDSMTRFTRAARSAQAAYLALAIARMARWLRTAIEALGSATRRHRTKIERAY